MPNNDFNRSKQGKNYTKDTIITYLYTFIKRRRSFASRSGYEAKRQNFIRAFNAMRVSNPCNQKWVIILERTKRLRRYTSRFVHHTISHGCLWSFNRVILTLDLATPSRFAEARGCGYLVWRKYFRYYTSTRRLGYAQLCSLMPSFF